MEYRIEVIKDAATGQVRYRVQDASGNDVVRWTNLASGQHYRRGDVMEVTVTFPVACQQGSGQGGRMSAERPIPPLGSLRRVVLAKPAPFDVMRQEVATRHGGGLNVPWASVAAVARQTLRAADDRLRELPPGAKVAVKHLGDGQLAWMEFAPGEDVVVPDASWTAFGRAEQDGVDSAKHAGPCCSHHGPMCEAWTCCVGCPTR